MKKILLVSVVFFSALACYKNNLLESEGIVKDYTGLDGCGLMIDLDSGERLEIVSLPSNTTLIANRRVKVKYELEARASFCMAGLTARIISLQYL